MKILMVTARYWPYRGGVEKHIERVSHALKEMGHEVVILTLTGPKKELPLHEVHAGIEIYRIKASHLGKRTQLRAIAWAASHGKILKTFDCIHGHDVILRGLARFAPQATSYLTFHGYEGYPVLPESILSKHKMLNQVKGTICAGAFIGTWYGVRCDIVEWGATDPVPAHAAKTHPSDLCFLGRLEEDTGVRVYLEALKILKEAGHEYRMLICGAGSLEDELREYVKREKLNVKFEGFVTDPDPYLRGTSVACVSGYLAILEAMIRKAAVACYYDTPIKEDYLRMAPYAKLIVIENTAEKLAKALQELLSGKRSQDTEKTYQFAVEHTWQKLATQYLELYAQYSS